jgi:WD40 repeat protein
MFRPTLFICASLALLALGVTLCQRPMSAGETAQIDRWIATLDDSNADVRETAALALGKQGARARATLPALKKALQDEEAPVRAAASAALQQISAALYQQDLLRQVKDKKLPADQRQKACRELAKSNWDDEAIIAGLEDLLSDPDVKELAAAALKYQRARKGVGAALVWTTAGGEQGVIFSPDGNTLVSAATEPLVQSWDARTGKQVASFRGTNPVCRPDGKTLTYRADHKTITWWDGKTGQELASLKGHPSTDRFRGFSPDGKTFATAAKDGTLRLWDTATGKEKATLKGHTGVVEAVSWSPDSKSLASASRDNTVRLWDAATGKEKATLKGQASVLWSPGGKTLATSDYSRFKDSPDDPGPPGPMRSEELPEIKLWDAATGKAKATLKSSFPACFSPDGKTFAGCTETGLGLERDQMVKLWDVASGKEKTSLKGHAGRVLSVSWSPDGRILASGGSDSTVKLWEAATGKLRTTLKGHTDSVRSVASARTVRPWSATRVGSQQRSRPGMSNSARSVPPSRG